METHLQRDIFVSAVFHHFTGIFFKLFPCTTLHGQHATTVTAHQFSNITQILQPQRAKIRLFLILHRLWVHLSPFQCSYLAVLLLKLLPRMSQFLRNDFFQPRGVSTRELLKTFLKVISPSSFVNLWQFSTLLT